MAAAVIPLPRSPPKAYADVLDDPPHGPDADRRPGRTKLTTHEQEPNPFELSFSRPSNDSSVRTDARDPAKPGAEHAYPGAEHAYPGAEHTYPGAEHTYPGAEHAYSRPSSSHTSRADTTSPANADPPPKLPPIAAIASPSDQSSFWAHSYSTNTLNSLRSGPLSPAMLAGPQPNSSDPSLPAFDISTLRTGFTPRTGLTPGTGLTPLVGGPVSFPPPSPNTAAFLAMMNNNPNGPAAATITPNTLSTITGILSTQQQQQQQQQHHHQQQHHQQQHHQHHQYQHHSSSSNPSPLSMSHPYSAMQSQRNDHSVNGYAHSAANAAETAANGLFLLSQAHQELTKREQAQARAGAQAASQNHPPPPSNGSANGRRGTKRKATYDASPQQAPAEPASTKRTRSSTTTSTSTGGRHQGRRASSAMSMDGMEEEEDDDDMMEAMEHGAKKSGSGNKKPETEEEKRKNFLERNRQAALKCRQRKKAWLAQLQAKVEFLSNENERLTSALVSSREEIARLSQLVGGAAVESGKKPQSGGSAPVSVNVSLPQAGKNAAAMANGRGYGY